MIDQTDEHLKAWISSVLQISNVTLAPPSDSQRDDGVSLYLLDLAPAVPSNGAGRTSIQLALRYLVTAWANEMETAHRWLGTLVVATMAHSEFEVELDRLPPEVWLAFRTIPRPAFILKAPLRVDRPEPVAPVVRAPLVMQSSPLVRLEGRVSSPNHVPLADIRVEIPSLQLATRTDTRGWFHFGAIPASSPPHTLRLVGHGRQIEIEIEQPRSSDEPLLISFDPTALEPVETR